MVVASPRKVEFLNKDNDVQYTAHVSIGCMIMEGPTIDTLRAAMSELPQGTDWTSVNISSGFNGENVQKYSRDQVTQMLNRKGQKPGGPKFSLF